MWLPAWRAGSSDLNLRVRPGNRVNFKSGMSKKLSGMAVIISLFGSSRISEKKFRFFWKILLKKRIVFNVN